ncbi:uncharacterized protein [Amphiura filiformis]|uniref:uncharacterized protein n=1 Tax=Amphiura filiformis TaxID=82378 RepID=UPI003B21B76A
MKYRQARQCYHPYCPKQGSFFGRFDKHLRTTHNLTVEQYDTLMELYEEQRSYLRKHPLDKSSKLENFCPTMEEMNPNHPIDPQTVKDKIDVKGNKTYPKRRLRTFSVVADNIKIFNTYQHGREDVEVHAADPKTKEQLILHFDTRKLVISKEHETIFMESIFWPFKDQSLLQLRQDNVCHIGKEPAPRLPRLNYIKSIIDKCLVLPLQYKCYICSRWHNFELMHSPRYSPDDFFEQLYM